MEQPGKKIRKIQYGVVPTLPTKIISLGTSVRFRSPKGGIVEYFVTEITENKNSYWETGSVEFNIYVSKTKESEDKLFWQRLALRPDLIEYEFTEGEEEFII